MKKSVILLLMAALSIPAAMADTTDTTVNEPAVVPVSAPAQETVKDTEETPATQDTDAAKAEDKAVDTGVKEETTPSAEN